MRSQQVSPALDRLSKLPLLNNARSQDDAAAGPAARPTGSSSSSSGDVFVTTTANVPHHSHAATEITGWKSESAGKLDWEGHRQTIKKLYIDEGKKLSEVIEIMAQEHNFVATSKMFKTRLTKWGYFKNNREADAMAILELKRQRDAAGKPTEIRVSGRTVQLHQVSKYLRRKKISLSAALDQSSSGGGSGGGHHRTAALARYITIRTPSPEPVSIRPPDAHRDAERLFSCVNHWIVGSFQSGRWTANSLGCASIVRYAYMYSDSAQFILSVSSTADLLQQRRYDEAGRHMRAAAAQIEKLLDSQPIDLLTCFVEVAARLSQPAPEVTRALIGHAAAMARVLLPSPAHPLRVFLEQLARASADDVLALATAAYQCQLDVWQAIKSQSNDMNLFIVWMCELSELGGFIGMPRHQVPALMDFQARAVRSMQGWDYGTNLLARMMESETFNAYVQSGDDTWEQVSMLGPDKPLLWTGIKKPRSRYSLYYVNIMHRHFAKEDMFGRDARESYRLLSSDLGSFFLRLCGAVADYLDAAGRSEDALAVSTLRDNVIDASEKGAPVVYLP